MLSHRLKTIASLVEKDINVIDVGCDHGLLDIYLTLYNNNKCIASDVNENALNSAISNIKMYNLEDMIKTVISNGLDNINIKKNTTVIIAGMGANTILDIIRNYNLESLIICSNNDYSLLRTELSKKYTIIEEVAVLDKKKYYIIFKLKLGTIKYSKKDIFLGPILKTKKDKETTLYYNYLYKTNLKIISSIPKKYIIKRLKLRIKNYWIKNR